MTQAEFLRHLQAFPEMLLLAGTCVTMLVDVFSRDPLRRVTYYLALRRAKVPAELHVYGPGGHGVGLGGTDPALTTWPDRLAGWLRTRGLLTA